MKRVTVIDYGIGNLLSVRRAFEHVKAEVVLTDSAKDIVDAERVVLPGVGAFGDGMRGLEDRSLVDAIQRYAEKGRPFLGICLGMQMMLDASEEFGSHRGLGLIPGAVVAIPSTGIDRTPHRVPHIGWSPLVLPPHRPNWSESILRDAASGDSVYFVHSFTAVPKRAQDRLADCHYDGLVISAAINRDNLYGCQFHPEKSGRVGLKIVENFLAI